MKNKWHKRFEMKNPGKVIVIFTFCAIVVTALLGGCDTGKTLSPKPDTEVNEPAEKPGANANEPADKHDNKAASPAGTLPDDPYSFTFMLDGDLYSLPTAFSTFASNGWEFIGSIGDFTLDKNYFADLKIQKGEHKVGIVVINNSNEDEKKPADCDVGGVNLFSSNVEGIGTELVFPGNLKIGDPGNRVKELYGEPTDFYESDTNIYYSYIKDEISYFSLSVNTAVDKSSGLVVDLDMNNFFN